MTNPKAGKGWRMLKRRKNKTIEPRQEGDQWCSFIDNSWLEEVDKIGSHPTPFFYRRRIASKPKMGRKVTGYAVVFKDREDALHAFNVVNGLNSSLILKGPHKLVIPIKEKE